MICKQCGQPLDPAWRQCRRCGRDVPATSDCGGFYGLVPSAAASVPQQHAPAQAPAAPLPEPRRTRKWPGILALLLCLAVMVTVIALLLIRLDKLNDRIDTLEEQLEENGVDMPVLQDAQIDLKLHYGKDKPEAELEAELDPFEGSMLCDAEFDSQLLDRITLQAEELEDVIVVTASYDRQQLCIELEAPPALLGEADGACEFAWSYRQTEQALWAKADGGFDIDNAQSRTTITVDADDYNDLESLELKLEITRENTQGGTLELTITGLRLPRQVEASAEEE